MPVVYVPGKGDVEFPDNMSLSQIKAAIERNLGPRSSQLAEIDNEIERRRQRLERGRAALSKEPEGLAAAAESVLNFLGSKSGRQESLARLEEQTADEIAALQNRAAYIQRTGEAPRELTTGERVLEVAKGAPRAVIRGVADIGGGLGVFGRPGEAAARKVAELGEAGVEALGLTPDELAQYDPSLIRPTQFSEALGSTVPLVAAQFLGRAAKPVQIALAGGMGAAEQRRGIEAQEAATGQPVSALDRALAQAGGFGVNLAELAPIPGLVAPRGGRALQRVTRSAVEEGGQEAGTQAAQNIVEALTYNPEQEISEGALESALLGGTVGGTIRGGTELVTRGAAAPAPEAELEEDTVSRDTTYQDMDLRGENLIESYENNRPVVRTESGAPPKYLYRIMSRNEFNNAQESGYFENPKEGRVHASGSPLIEYNQPGSDNVLVRFDYDENDGWRAKQSGVGVVAIADQIPFSRGSVVAQGSREDIDNSIASSASSSTPEEEAPPVPTTAFGEEGAAEPISERPFPTVSRDTADIEAPPAGFEPERSTPSPDAVRTPIRVAMPKEKLKDKVSRKFSDSLQRVAQFEAAIGEARGARVPFSESARDAFARYFGKASERIDEIDRDFQNPITKKIADYNLPQKRVDEYLVAKSAPARNEMIARINPEMPDAGAGMTNAEAEEIIQNAEADGIRDQLEDIAGDVLTMAKATREGMVRDGLITRENADVWERTQPYYVPLKGIAAGGDMAVSEEDTPHIDYNPAGFRSRYKESMSPTGRGKENLPLSPLAYTLYDAKAAAIRGEKNIASNKLLDLVMANPSNVAQVFTKENPDYEMVPDPKTGVLRRQAVDMARRQKEYFLVKREGIPHYIKINDPLLMRALTNASAKEFEKLVSYMNSWALFKVAPATRMMSNMFTTYNPVWAGLNYMKDAQSAIYNISAEQDRVDGRLAGKEIAKGVWNDMTSPSNFRKMFRITFNKEATTAEERQMFAMFQQAKEDGALTGWIVNEPVEAKIQEIQDALDRHTAKGGKKLWFSTKEGVADVLQKLQDFNSVFENITRFSVYKNALDAGLTRDEAASMAREVTVDFNKRGELGPLISSLYSFANAAIQGNARLLRSLRGSTAAGGRTRAQKLALGLVGIGALQSLLGRAASDDDEDGKSFYDKIPQYEKDRFIIIPHPWTGGETYTKIPLPYGISVFHNIGANMADFGLGKATVGDIGMRTLSSFANNFSPISVSFESPAGFFNSFVPTFFKPVSDLIINENNFGSTIYNEPFQEGAALSNVPRAKTPEVFKEIVRIVNEGTGGYGAKKGDIDIPAEALPYLIKQYTGGAGRFVADITGLAKNAGSGDFDKISPNDIPYYELVHSEVTSNATLGDYYDRINAIAPVQTSLRNAEGSEKITVRKKSPLETNSRILAAKDNAEKKIREYNKQLKKLREAPGSDYRDKQIEKLTDMKTKAMSDFNRVYNQVEERAR